MADINEIKAYIEKLTKKEEDGEDVQELWQLMNSDFEKFKQEYQKRFKEEIEQDNIKKEVKVLNEEIKEIKKETRTTKDEINELRKEFGKRKKEEIEEEKREEIKPKIEVEDIRKEFAKEEEVKKDEEKYIEEVEIKVGKEKYEIEKIWKEEKKEKKEIKTRELVGLLIALLGIVGLICTILYKFLYGFSFGIRTQLAIILGIFLLIFGITIQLKNKVLKKDIFSSFAFKKVITIPISLLLIFTSISLTNYYFMNTEPNPIIEIKYNGKEISEAMVGEILTFNAGKSYDKDGYIIQFRGGIVNYTWDFGDGELSYDKTTEHYYLEDGIKIVKLTVRDNKGLEKTIKKEIKIKPLILIVPNKKIGDIGNYTINGKIGVWNNESGLYVYKMGYGTITLKGISLNLLGTLKTNVRGYADKEDGVKNTHKTLEILTTQKINFNGNSNADFNGNDIQIPTSGYNNVDDKAYIDLYNNKTIQKNTNSSLSMTFSWSSFSKTIKYSDEIISYSDLTKEQFNFEEVYLNREFNRGNPTSLEYKINKKETTYYSKVQNVEKVKVGNEDKPSLKIQMTLDDNTMKRRGFNYFIAEFWVSKEFSFPLKTKIFAYGKQTDAEFLIDITISINSFERGKNTIEHSCLSQHYSKSKSEFKSWSFSPEGRGSFSFSPSEAIDMALNKNNNLTKNFRDYVHNETKNQSYVVFANYTEEDNKQRWNFTFGRGGNETIYNLTVVKEGNNFTFYDLGKSWMFSQTNTIFIQSKNYFSPKNTKFNLNDKILTIESFEDILKNDSKAKNVFTNKKIDYSFYFFEIKVDLPYSNIDINAIFSEADKSNYGYLLKSKDNSFIVGIDSENGQLIYVIEHEEN